MTRVDCLRFAMLFLHGRVCRSHAVEIIELKRIMSSRYALLVFGYVRNAEKLDLQTRVVPLDVTNLIYLYQFQDRWQSEYSSKHVQIYSTETCITLFYVVVSVFLVKVFLQLTADHGQLCKLKRTVNRLK